MENGTSTGPTRCELARSLADPVVLQQEGLEHLTTSGLRILRLLDRDLSKKEIARELVVTPGTVKVHTNKLYRKLSVDNRRAAVSLASRPRALARDQGTKTPRR